MLCLRPNTWGMAGPLPCGKCMACRINRRRDWTARLLLHHAGHQGSSAWVTLTYGPSSIPTDSQGRGILSRVDVRNFIQRLRRELGGLRYVVVGEYGDQTFRPHYHALLWFDAMDVSAEWAIGRCWREGFISVGEISPTTVEYTISYILKRMVDPLDTRLEGRTAEFARYSHGLGATALVELRRLSRPGVDGVLELPREFRLDGRLWPIPKYLRRKLEDEGFSFTRVATELEEEAFVRALRARPRALAFDSILEFRAAVSEGIEGRRDRGRVRLGRKLIGRKKFETL